MKRFLAVFTGSETSENMKRWEALSESAREEREKKGMKAWMQWGKDHEKSVVFDGAPLGTTKLINNKGISDIHNQMAAFVVVQAKSHEEAAKMFVNHPHFTIFPGDGVEVMECLPIPGQD
jgi:hypothetical protein